MTNPPAQPGLAAPSLGDSAELDLVAEWMTRQRWYANKGALPALERIGGWSLPTDAPGVDLVTHLLLDHTVGKPALYQVPIAYRGQPDGAEAALIGERGGRFLYDGPHDPAYTAAVLQLVAGREEIVGERTLVTGSRASGADGTGLVSRVLTGEQSNTSIIYESDDPATAPVILKLFRAIHDGQNPDVELQTALAAAGSDAVPRPVGSVLAEWDDRGLPAGRACGHVAFAQEFLPGATDAWRLALAAAAAGEDFVEQAHALGSATAGVHATLRAALPHAAATPADVAAAVHGMHDRLSAAIAVAPQLAEHAAAIEAAFAFASRAAWPAQQRIHGDLHLGQVLGVPRRGWVLVDFEGEPLRPMRERSRLDSPLRDVAGMLRSFDYVAASLSDGGFSAHLSDWAHRARTAFQAGYDEASGGELARDRALVDAFELDKALYETVYEARNRPDWLHIPVAAIRRLVVG